MYLEFLLKKSCNLPVTYGREVILSISNKVLRGIKLIQKIVKNHILFI